MVLAMTLLLCDVGGTFIRFALKRQGSFLTAPQKLRAADYPVFEEAVRHFLASSEMSPHDILALGLAFSSRNAWQVTQESVAGLLPRAALYKINDFEANAYGVLDISEEDIFLLNRDLLPTGQRSVGTKCVVGPGTGLGLAYIVEGPQGKMVQKTHGGHMRPAVLGEDSYLLFQSLAALRSDGTVPIYEDVLSGPGLYNLYRVFASRNHLGLEYRDTHEMLVKGRNDPLVIQSLKVFHEWLGVFVHQAVAFGNSYGGVYLTGGIMDKLVSLDLFDSPTFFEAFHQKNVPVVMADVLATPVYWIRDEYVSLRGLCTRLETNTKGAS
jgi:glucokinase